VTPGERESLVLRRMATLQRAGRTSLDALVLASDGLPGGALRDRVEAGRRALEAGTPSDDLFGRDVGVDALLCAAEALDVRASAASAVRLARIYGVAAILAPQAVLVATGWFGRVVGLDDMSGPSSFTQLGEFFGYAQGAAIVFMVVGFASLKWVTAGFAPGVRRLRRAARLLEVAAVGGEPGDLVRGAMETAYFVARRGAVGAAAASAELGAEVRREGEAMVALFRHLAPPLAAAALLFVILCVHALVSTLTWGTGGMLL